MAAQQQLDLLGELSSVFGDGESREITDCNAFKSDKGEYIAVTLNDFLLNAGVLGLIKIFRLAENYENGCERGKDYIISGQTLYISRAFLEKRDIAGLFIRAMVYYLGNGTKFKRVMDKKGVLDSLYKEPKPEDKAWTKNVDDIYKEFTEMLLKNSYKSGYIIMSEYENVRVPELETIEKLKKEKDYFIKKRIYDELIDILRQDKVQEVLKFKDILYSTVTMFYADNQGSGAAFLSKREIDPALAYRQKFIEPLIRELNTPEKSKTEPCIECGQLAGNFSNTSAGEKTPIAISVFVDTADDLGKKKSYYWKCRPDAYLCPLCAFICSLSPLGFHYYGNDGIFINNNSDIDTILAFDAALEESDVSEDKNSWFKLYNTFTSEKIDKLSERVSNIQVVIREKDNARYKLNTVDKQTVMILDTCKSHLLLIKTRYIKNSGEFVNVYQQTVENILAKRSQYPLITKIFRIILNEGGQTEYLFRILQIQITQRGGKEMPSNIKRAFAAKKHGEAMREEFTKGLSEADKDNKLRGLVYQLLNAVSLGNRDKFMELIIRSYSGEGHPVPDVFFSCFSSEEDFKEIGFAYLLGLKSEGYKKEEEGK